MSGASTNDGWGTINEAAAYLGVHRDTVRRWISNGEIEAKRYGPRLIRVNLNSIDAGAQKLGGDAG